VGVGNVGEFHPRNVTPHHECIRARGGTAALRIRTRPHCA
jgi:hypothetical protein